MMEQRQMLYSRVVQGQTTHMLQSVSQSSKDSSSNVKLVHQHVTNVSQTAKLHHGRE